MNQVEIQDRFFSRYKELIRTEMIPYQWSVSKMMKLKSTLSGSATMLPFPMKRAM